MVVAAGFSPEGARGDRVRGSMVAVKEVLDTEGPVVVANVPAGPRVGKRPSVVARGIWSVACVPLRYEGRVIGVIYMDSRAPGRFTALDIEVVEALAEHAATVLAESDLDRDMGPAGDRPEDQILSELQQRLAESLARLGPG